MSQAHLTSPHGQLPETSSHSLSTHRNDPKWTRILAWSAEPGLHISLCSGESSPAMAVRNTAQRHIGPDHPLLVKALAMAPPKKKNGPIIIYL